MGTLYCHHMYTKLEGESDLGPGSCSGRARPRREIRRDNHSRYPGSGTLVWEPPVSGLGTTLFVVLRRPFLWSPPPLFSFVVRAAAANVNPHTRLSHMTPFSGRDWCTRERCRLMMQESQIFSEFPADDSQDFAASSRISQDSDDAQGSSTPPPTPLKPGACSTEASLQPRA